MLGFETADLLRIAETLVFCYVFMVWANLVADLVDRGVLTIFVVTSTVSFLIVPVFLVLTFVVFSSAALL